MPVESDLKRVGFCRLHLSTQAGANEFHDGFCPDIGEACLGSSRFDERPPGSSVGVGAAVKEDYGFGIFHGCDQVGSTIAWEWIGGLRVIDFHLGDSSARGIACKSYSERAGGARREDEAIARRGLIVGNRFPDFPIVEFQCKGGHLGAFFFKDVHAIDRHRKPPGNLEKSLGLLGLGNPGRPRVTVMR